MRHLGDTDSTGVSGKEVAGAPGVADSTGVSGKGVCGALGGHSTVVSGTGVAGALGGHRQYGCVRGWWSTWGLTEAKTES